MTWHPLPSQRDPLRPLAASLHRLHTTMGLARPDTVAVLHAEWESLLGTRLARRCALDSLRGSELVISTDDPAVAEHLRWSSTDLIGAVNGMCQAAVVESITVRVRRR